MAERFKRSPSKASTYAFRTYHNKLAIKKNATINNNLQKRNRETSYILNKQYEQHGLHEISSSYPVNFSSRNSSSHNINKYENADFIADKIPNIKAIDDNVIDTPLSINKNDEQEEIRKNVWSDVDDEIYIAKVIELRTSNEARERDKRDTSAYVIDSDDTAKVVNSVKLDKYEEMWDLEPTDLTECDCLGPPPEFLLPPPPRPPFLQAEYYCGDDPIPDLETCDTEPVSSL